MVNKSTRCAAELTEKAAAAVNAAALDDAQFLAADDASSAAASILSAAQGAAETRGESPLANDDYSSQVELNELGESDSEFDS
uniref:Uncharacterized protein n=1 Tax=Peronospora matthiolae TaxID=2874970 RepID=A0AAV1UT31_9STRA